MDQNQEDQERIGSQEAVLDAPPELTLDLDDNTLVDFIDAYTKKAKQYFDDEKKIKEKRKKNKKYYFGRQLDDVELKNYEKKVLDNVIKEGEDQLRPIVLSRLPDIVVTPGTTNNDKASDTAEAVSKVLNAELDDRTLRRILTRAFRDHPIYYTAVIKYRWDPEMGRFGGVRWENIHPENVIVDSTATENNQEQMKIIIHYVEKSLKDWTMLFPKKEEELIQYARDKGKLGKGELNEKSLAVSLKLPEVWFDFVKKGDDFDPENPEFEHLSGVVWKAGKIILDKRRNPNWDWKGEERLFLNGQPVPEDLIPQIALMGNQIEGIERQTTTRNFFGKPRKPFIFVGFEQYGEMAYDETSRIEDNIPLQDNYDDRTLQIKKMIDGAQGKHVFSTQSGITKESIEEMDLDDWTEDVVIDGDLRQVHAFITKEQPSNAMFGDLSRTHDRMLAKMAINPAMRGEIQTDTATTTQIAREQGFTAADELANSTIVDVSIQMAEAQLHMMKLRYEPEHFQAILGRLGEQAFDNLTADMIEDGMEVSVTASGTDKLETERRAQEEAQLGLIDPINFYKDTGRDDPEKRAEMLFMFQQSPELYFKKFVQGQDIPDIAAQVQQMNQQNLAQAGAGGQAPQQPSPQQPSAVPQTPQGPPQGSSRGLMGRAGAAIGGLFGGGR